MEVEFNTFSKSVGLKKVLLKDLSPDLDNSITIGIIIAKQRPRKFIDKTKESETFRAVWNFTIRDSQRDYINVTYWGNSDVVCTASDKFYTGDIVEIRNPRINIRKFNDIGEQFRPVVTSPYSLSLNEQSEILSFTGDAFYLKSLLNYPTKPLAGFVPLRDIQNQGANLKERYVDILGAVRSIGTIRNVNIKNGQECQLREIILFDHTSPGLKLTIWDTDVMTRASTWKARSTILFITDARVEWSNFLRSYTASLTNRSIVTENPVGEEAATLANYAKNAPLENSAILDQMVTAFPDPDTIQNVMCVQQVCNKVNAFLSETCPAEHQFTALMYVFVTKLDLDGQSPITSIKCSHCKNWLKSTNTICENSECPVVARAVSADMDITFDIKVHLSDHTGTLTNCRLSGATAEQVLECSVQQFLRMTDDQKSNLKWKFLLERCAVRIMVLLLNRRTPLISIISCARADPLETAQKLPTC